jgi:hypothetical protein
MIEQDETCGAMQYTPQWQETLGHKLFPPQHCFFPEVPNAKDGFGCNTEVSLSFMDRLRVLLTGKLLVVVKMTCDGEIGNHSTNTCAYPPPPKFLQRK